MKKTLCLLLVSVLLLVSLLPAAAAGDATPPENAAALSEDPTTSEPPGTDPAAPADDPTEPPTEPVTEPAGEPVTQPEEPSTEPTEEKPEEPSTEPPAPLLALRLNEESVICGVGETLTLFVTDKTGARVPVSFTTDAPALLTQTAVGVFLATAPGFATVTATAADGRELFCFVTIWNAPHEITLGDEEVTLGVGDTYEVEAFLPVGTYSGSLQYVSGDESVLFPLGENRFYAISGGSTTITVFAQNGVSESVSVTVLPLPDEVTLSDDALTLGVGETYKLSFALPEGTFSRSVSFQSNGAAVTVSKTGKLIAIQKGVAIVTVTAQGGAAASCTVTVKKAPKSIKIPALLKLNPGDTYTFTPKLASSAGAHKLTIRSDNKKVFKQTDDMTFTAKKTGSATVTVTAYNGVSATCDVQVCKLPKKLRFASSRYQRPMGTCYAPKIILPENTYCSSYSFTSSNPDVASVDETGTVWFRSVGEAVITAETPNGKSATCTVSVTNIPVPCVSQLPRYPTGCEAASCTALLQYYGYDITVDEMVATIPRENLVRRNGVLYGPDINKKFVGNPTGSYTSATPGYGAFSPCITKALQKAINARGGGHTAKRISGCSFKKLLKQVSKGRPAIVWATYQMMNPKTKNSWTIVESDGTTRQFSYPRGTHVFVLKGYSKNHVTLMDPYTKSNVTYSISTFEARWNLLGKQAIVLV